MSTLPLLFRSPRPLVNFTLIAINALIFFYQLSLDGPEETLFFYKYGLIPVELSSGDKAIIAREVVAGELRDITTPIPIWGTVFTSMFIHGSFLHIIANMLFLYGFGGKVEYKLGHIKYLLFYFGAGIAAAWTQVAIDLDSVTVLIGASGAISGVVAGYLLAYPYRYAVALLVMFFILPMVFRVDFGILGGPSAGVAYMAHLGGAVAGVLLMAAYKFLLREPILPRRSWRTWGHPR